MANLARLDTTAPLAHWISIFLHRCEDLCPAYLCLHIDFVTFLHSVLLQSSVQQDRRYQLLLDFDTGKEAFSRYNSKKMNAEFLCMHQKTEIPSFSAVDFHMQTRRCHVMVKVAERCVQIFHSEYGEM